MKPRLLPAFAALALTFAPALAQDTQTTTETQTSMEALANVDTAAEFVPMAAMGGLFEIESGKLAMQRGGSDAVKQHAEKIVADHTKASQELEATAQQAGMTVRAPAELDPRYRKMLDQLAQTQGAEFDRLFAEQQARAHQEAIALFSAYAKNGDNQALRSFAEKNLPVLQQHLEMVQSGQKS